MAPKKAPKAVSETCGKWLQFDAVSETQGLVFWKRSYLMWQLPKLNQPIPKRLAFANEVYNGKSLSRYCEWRGFWNENEILKQIAIMFFDENAIFEKTVDLSNVKLVPFQLPSL